MTEWSHPSPHSSKESLSSSPLPPPPPPQRSYVLPHMSKPVSCGLQRSSAAPFSLSPPCLSACPQCLRSLSNSKQLKPTVIIHRRTYGAHDMMTLSHTVHLARCKFEITALLCPVMPLLWHIMRMCVFLANYFLICYCVMSWKEFWTQRWEQQEKNI